MPLTLSAGLRLQNPIPNFVAADAPGSRLEDFVMYMPCIKLTPVKTIPLASAALPYWIVAIDPTQCSVMLLIYIRPSTSRWKFLEHGSNSPARTKVQNPDFKSESAD